MLTWKLKSQQRGQHDKCLFRGLHRYPLVVLVLLSRLVSMHSMDLGQCNEALGMENGEIPDEDITASSMYDPSLGPKHARLHKDKGGGAWCPRNMVAKEGKEYLEVNLHNPRILTSTQTQGRFGNGHGVEYTEEYFIEYWRPGFNKWVQWRNRRGMHLLVGNNNPYTEKEQIFDPPIIATRIRFIPYTSHIRTVCMRVELYGCPWNEGLISYSMPQGVLRGSEIDLTDRTYDGREDGGYLSGGIGQLVDGQKGPDNFRIDSNGNGKGYEWVGWRNDTPSMTGHPVEIIFEFDYLRNFTAMHLHTNNYFTKDVQVFSHAKVYLSPGDNQFNGEPVHFSYMPDSVLEQAREVTIKLHSRAGRYLKLQMYFAARWIMLSEVIFESVLSEWNNTDEDDAKNRSTIILATGSPYHNIEDPLQRDEVKSTLNKEDGTDHNIFPDKSKEPSESKQFIGLVIGILTTVIVMLLAAILLIFYRNRRFKAALTPATFYDLHGDFKVSALEEIADKGPICPPLPALYQAGVYNTTNATITTPQLHKTSSEYTGPPDAAAQLQPIIPLLVNTAINLARPVPPVREYPCNPPPIPPPPEKYYASTEICKSPVLPPLPPSPPSPNTPPAPASMSAKASSSLASYSPEDMLTEDEDDENLGLGSRVNSGGSGGSCCIVDFPRERLNIVESLGCGYYGDIHLCEVDSFPGYDKIFRSTSSELVVVKSLRPGSSKTLRIEFQQEAKKLARVSDRNVARLLGASLEDDPMCIVSENGQCGDLNQFLQSHIAETSTVHTAKTLSFGTLIYMATQIASGMKYLEEMNFIHQDLATRNCLVNQNFVVKVSDLGPGRTAYAADYFKVEGRPPLPIRWMAWESMLLFASSEARAAITRGENALLPGGIPYFSADYSQNVPMFMPAMTQGIIPFFLLKGKNTSKSDVWSFAVTFWEILTFAREQPFEELPDHRIVENATFFYEEEERRMILPMPKNCPKEMYDLMRECWQRNDVNRPTFQEIHLFLQRKNLGYKPTSGNDT